MNCIYPSDEDGTAVFEVNYGESKGAVQIDILWFFYLSGGFALHFNGGGGGGFGALAV